MARRPPPVGDGRLEIWSGSEREVGDRHAVVQRRGLVDDAGGDADETDEGGATVTPQPEERPEPTFKMPAPLVQELTAHKTAAIRAELAHNPDVALAAVVHAMLVNLFGTVERVASPLNENGTTVYYFTLSGDTHVYRVTFNPTAKDANLEVPFIKVGAKITISFRDNGTVRSDVVNYDDLGIKVG